MEEVSESTYRTPSAIQLAMNIIDVDFGADIKNDFCLVLDSDYPVSTKDMRSNSLKRGREEIRGRQNKKVDKKVGTFENSMRRLIPHHCVLGFYTDDDPDSLKYIVRMNKILPRVCYDKLSSIVEDDANLGDDCVAVLDKLFCHGSVTFPELRKLVKMSVASLMVSLQRLVDERIVECHQLLPNPVLALNTVYKRAPEIVEQHVIQAATPAQAKRFPVALDQNSKGVVFSVNFEECIRRAKVAVHNVDDTESQNERIRTVIIDKYGENGYTIFNHLSHANVFLSHNTIAVAIGYSVEEVEESLRNMYRDGFVKVCQKLHTGVPRPLLFWKVQRDSVIRMMLEHSFAICLPLHASVTRLKKTIEEQNHEAQIEEAEDEIEELQDRIWAAFVDIYLFQYFSF